MRRRRSSPSSSPRPADPLGWSRSLTMGCGGSKVKLDDTDTSLAHFQVERILGKGAFGKVKVRRRARTWRCAEDAAASARAARRRTGPEMVGPGRWRPRAGEGMRRPRGGGRTGPPRHAHD